MISSISPTTNKSRRETKRDDLRTAVHFENVPSTPTRTAIETPRAKKKPLPSKSSEPFTTRNLDDVQYFDNLIRDLAEISRLLSQNPSLFRYAHLSLMEEVYNVWGRLRSNQNTSNHQSELQANNRLTALKRITPPRSSTDGSSLNNLRTRSSIDSQSVSPFKKWPMGSGDAVLPAHWMGHFDANFHELPVHVHKLEKKVFIPEVPNYNFIGRILGPRGISARQIEADTNCKILIRGKGSVKDPEKEERLMGQPGYEHLCENLHVHISTEGPVLADCQRRVERAVSIIESLLTPDYDEYKKTQLLQLAIINGTYRPYKKRQRCTD